MFSLYFIQRRYREGTEYVQSIYREDSIRYQKMKVLQFSPVTMCPKRCNL